MTSYNAARYMDEDNKGIIDNGFDANILVLDKKLNIKKIFLDGDLIL